MKTNQDWKKNITIQEKNKQTNKAREEEYK